MSATNISIFFYILGISNARKDNLNILSSKDVLKTFYP